MKDNNKSCLGERADRNEVNFEIVYEKVKKLSRWLMLGSAINKIK